MYIRRLTIQNFRCFGPEPTEIGLGPTLTALVGVNGAGKTAALDALQRLFGVTQASRTIRPSDFHVPVDEVDPPRERLLVIEAHLAFPELEDDGDTLAVPGFFQHMTVNEGGDMLCRLRLAATWTNDGSVDGVVEETLHAVCTLGDFDDGDLHPIKAADRSLVQLVYIPATRDADAQMRAFLRGRLWRAARWSDNVRTVFDESGTELSDAFGAESPVDIVQRALRDRWREVHGADHEAEPRVRALDGHFEEFVRRVEVVLTPVHGRDRPLAELSDGQRSLFTLALAAATLDVEDTVVEDATAGFAADDLPLPALTLIAVEEPENSLAPYYLARTVGQLRGLGGRARVQTLLSSHSASILARVRPEEVRHFRLDPETRTSRVRSIRLPDNDDAGTYVREAVQAYPELYFARFVVFGEGVSEEVVLPRLARALGLEVDRSFVAIVPLGGRHVHHFWRLVHDIDVPHATLLDLDVGRHGGGWGRIKTTCRELEAFGTDRASLYLDDLVPHVDGADGFDNLDAADTNGLARWVAHLETFGVFFSAPLDIDYTMLRAFPEAYRHPASGGRGPSGQGDPRDSVLGGNGRADAYDDAHMDALRWYRYLFLGRGKPATHVRALQHLDDETLARDSPDALRRLLTLASNQAAHVPDAADDS